MTFRSKYVRITPPAVLTLGVRTERLWKSIKFEEVYPRAYESVSHA